MTAGGALLVAGTSSDAGKSALVAGICRMLRRRGVRVAPFKAQNMSNNSVVTREGGEIGRAQAVQARACGLAPSARFNPILLKPGDDHRSHLVVRGKSFDTVSAHEWSRHREELREVAVSELADLRGEFDAVICEGAGSPAEINLRRSDIANLGLARAAHLPVIVVGDIDRGGVLAHLFGTLAVLEPEDQRLISGFVINKFRGSENLLRPGLACLAERTGRPVLGVLPFRDELWLDAEDSLGILADRPVGRPGPAVGAEWLTVAAIRLPRVSNTADVEALACEPGVAVRWVDNPSRLVDADAVVLPGTRATVADLAWLRRRGFADALTARAETGRPILGICGGYQMLGRTIVDAVESGAGSVAGLGLLDMEVEFGREKTVGQTRVHGAAGSATAGIPADGYEIHHGRVVRSGDPSWLLRDRPGPTPEGSRGPALWGTHLHGVLESDDFRRAWLTEVARCAGRSGFVVAPDTSVSEMRESQIDLLADLVEHHLDTTALQRLLDHGAPAESPVLDTRLRASTPVAQGR